MDDNAKISENLPPEETTEDEGDGAEKSPPPSSSISQHSSIQNLVVEDGDGLRNTIHPLPPKSFEESKRKLMKELFGDDSEEEASDKRDNAENSPSSPLLSQCSTTQNRIIRDDDDVPKTRQSLPDKSFQELTFKFTKEKRFGDDYDSAETGTTSDEQDSNADSNKSATTEDDDLISTATTSKKAVNGGDIREIASSSSEEKQPEHSGRETSPLPEKITPAEGATENLAEETKPSNTGEAEPTSPAKQAEDSGSRNIILIAGSEKIAQSEKTIKESLQQKIE